MALGDLYIVESFFHLGYVKNKIYVEKGFDYNGRGNYFTRLKSEDGKVYCLCVPHAVKKVRKGLLIEKWQ